MTCRGGQDTEGSGSGTEISSQILVPAVTLGGSPGVSGSWCLHLQSEGHTGSSCKYGKVFRM